MVDMGESSHAKLAQLRVVLVHDWLTGMRGGERCLEVFCEIFPDADLYSLIHLEGKLSDTIESMRIHTSFLQRFPFLERRYRHYLPLFPRAVESMRLPGCDLVLSSSHCVAKGVVPPEGALHVCYCFTPMRYVWDMYEEYFGPGRSGLPARLAMKVFAPGLRKWDKRTAERVDQFVAISNHVAERIKRHYGRESDVVYPPVDCSRFTPKDEHEDFYLVVSALAPYKRVDLAVEACRALKRRLLIVGTGQDEARLRRLAGPAAEFLGWQSDEQVADLYGRCRAFLFPGEEDFGIAPLEAMASGRPVIAFGKGGALETVVDGETGTFFREQTVESLVEAMRVFEKAENEFDPEGMRRHAEGFDRAVFKNRIAAYLTERLEHRDAG